MEEGSRVVKAALWPQRGASGRSPDASGAPQRPLVFGGSWSVLRRRQWHPTPVFLPGDTQGRGSLVGCRLWGRTESDTTDVTQQQQQVSLEGEPFRERLTQPGPGGHQPEEVGQVVSHLLDEFHLLLQDMALQKVMEVGVCVAEPGQADPGGPGSDSCPWEWWLHSILGFTPLVSRSFCMFWKRAQRQHWFCIFQRLLMPLSFSSAHHLELHCCCWNRSPERGKCPQMHVELVVDGGLHHGGIIMTNTGACGWQ